MISDARGGHVSPGVYTEERDVTYSVKSLGITSLGLVGETLKGPAFEPIKINKWSEFKTYFGGTSSEKFKGSNTLKYELPYIAKDYLKESTDLTVCRVLGLSGFENGTAYTITAKVEVGTGVTYPIAVIRSKADYSNPGPSGCTVGINEAYTPKAKCVKVAPYTGVSYGSSCEMVPGTSVEYPLSGYILDGQVWKMVCHTPTSAETTGYILKDGVMKFCDDIHSHTGETIYQKDYILDKFALKYKTSKNVDKVLNVSLNSADRDYLLNILTIDPLLGSNEIFLESLFDYSLASILSKEEYEGHKFTYGDIESVAEHDFKEPFRPAQTPWVVSEAVASTETIQMKRLFKFYTISDGNASNYQVKISIENVRPDDALFDVVVRDFYDDDSKPMILEKFTNCSMTRGNSNYIGLKIGTYDGEFEIKSKYITVRINEDSEVEGSVPCGFLGYPIPKYNCSERPITMFATTIDEDIKLKRQYFGSNSANLDQDIINYKGVAAYSDGDFSADKITNGFHLDSILHELILNNSGSTMKNSVILVDGESGFTFSAVDPRTKVNGRQYSEKIPRIISEAYAEDTIYEDKTARKFTMYTYGGFDGWDIFRTSRTNTDKYKATKYYVPTDGEGVENTTPFYRKNSSAYKELNATLDLRLPSNAISSDYYAYLGGYNQFLNPEDIDINIFATPGIDWVNNTMLVEDVIDIIEDADAGRGGDAIYIPTTPQFSDENASESYTPEELADLLDLKEINSSYCATYWPWVKIYDSEDSIYLNIPATKDAIRNMAYTDNNKFPWFAPAGTSRGKVDCERAVIKTDKNDEDTLYGNAMNPIKTFAKDGVMIWGNKTMYNKETPLNRINVRRLMLRVKKLVINASKELIFDQYDQSLEKQFKSIVEPILSDVQKNRGIYDYKVLTECTEETRDQHILPAKIMIKPTPTLEYISISFVVYPESVQFDESL